jgi:hypothetical protein
VTALEVSPWPATVLTLAPLGFVVSSYKIVRYSFAFIHLGLLGFIIFDGVL